MINLFLHILCTVSLFLLFRLFKKYSINSLHAVIINYAVCIITGLLILNNKSLILEIKLSDSWVQMGLLTGSLFVPTFYLMGLTVEKVSVSVSTVANKMSLIIPVLFSLFYLEKGPSSLSNINKLGILVSLLSIFLTCFKKRKPEIKFR